LSGNFRRVLCLIISCISIKLRAFSRRRAIGVFEIGPPETPQ
jgi:hypothetical protein